MYYIGVDVGGTTVKLGFFDVEGNLLDKWEIPTRTENGGEKILPDVADSIKAKMAEKNVKLESNQMIMDYDKLDIENLTLRYRENGDVISLFKDGKKKKLKDFFIDKKIPKEERDKIILVCNENEVVAVIGHRIAEPYKRQKNTKRGLVITYDTGN